ncbi:hypothetical protein KKI24_02880 [bacterium]|nr:hypothetical protein [bacterium]
MKLLTHLKRLFNRYVLNRPVIFGYDPGSPEGDHQVEATFRKHQDGTIEITDIKRY